MTLTDQLAEIKKRLEAATPGQWVNQKCFSDWGFPFVNHVGPVGTKTPIELRYGGKVNCFRDDKDAKLNAQSNADAELIAHCPTDLKKLIAVVEILGGELLKHQDGIEIHLANGKVFNPSKALSRAAELMKGEG